MKQKLKFKETEIGLIPKEWDITKLIELSNDNSEIVAGPFGSNLKVSDYREEGLPIIRLQNIERYMFIDKDMKYTSKEKYDKLKYHSFQAGDIVLAKLGAPIGKTCKIPNEIPKGLVVADVVRIRLQKNKIDSDFLLYVLNSNIVKHQLASRQTGSTRPRVNLSDVREIIIPLPSIHEQKKIAKILSDLDSRIKILQKQNETLESIGKLIFKNWFVDFEFPNNNRKPYKSSGGKMQNGEYGSIPIGWQETTVQNEFNLTMGQSPPGNSYNTVGEGVPFFQGRTDFGFRFPKIRMFTTEPKRFANAFDTLVSVRAPVGDINMADCNCCIGRGLAAIRHKLGALSYTFYLIHTLKEQFDYFEAEGTVYGSINKKGFENLRILSPPNKLVNAFEKLVKPVDEMIHNNHLEGLTLNQIRNSLLPKLILGKIRVNA